MKCKECEMERIKEERRKWPRDTWRCTGHAESPRNEATSPPPLIGSLDRLKMIWLMHDSKLQNIAMKKVRRTKKKRTPIFLSLMPRPNNGLNPRPQKPGHFCSKCKAMRLSHTYRIIGQLKPR